METISGDTSSQYIQPSLPESNTSNSPIPDSSYKTIPASTPKAKLNALTDLTDKAANAGTDIREDVILRAKSLLNDPDWLSDDKLYNLSQRLLNSEDF